jgi:AraC-like DNA-binding protein
MEHVEATPSGRLAPLVARYSGYRYEGTPPGTHLGLPSPYLTVVISLGKPTRMATKGEFAALAGGLHTRPVIIEHDGDQYGVQLALTPAGARSLLGVPAAELASAIVPLDALLGSRAVELIERMGEAATWRERFAAVDEVLSRHRDRLRTPPAELRHAWHRLTAPGGVRVRDVAEQVGWSRRHLGERFAAEYGLTPKEAARVARLDRAKRLLQRADRPGLAAVAAACGFYDQAHLAREWNDLVGRPPTAWLAAEDLPFVQDDDA